MTSRALIFTYLDLFKKDISCQCAKKLNQKTKTKIIFWFENG